VRTDKEHLALSWGLPEGSDSIGIILWPSRGVIKVKGVFYDRRGTPLPDER
jgi:hypothetical protein